MEVARILTSLCEGCKNIDPQLWQIFLTDTSFTCGVETGGSLPASWLAGRAMLSRSAKLDDICCMFLWRSQSKADGQLSKLQDRNGEATPYIDPLVVRVSLLSSLQLPLKQLSNARVALKRAIRKLGRRPTLRRTLLRLVSIANCSKQWALMWFRGMHRWDIG